MGIMTAPSPRPSDPELTAQAADFKPGAIPPTGGVAPEDAPAAHSAAEARSARDDLADGIDLIRRAARKALGALDPRIERAAESAVERLRELDAEATAVLRRSGGAQFAELETLVGDFGRELSSVLERVAKRLDADAPLRR